MEVPNVLDPLELCDNDLDLAIKAVDKLVKKVSNGKSENCKTKLLAKMQDITNALLQKPQLEISDNQMVEDLLEWCSDNTNFLEICSKRDLSTEKSLIHMASENGYVTIVKKLIEEKIAVNVTNFKKDTPLHCASSNGHAEMAKLLIENGAPVNAKTINRKDTPLHLAALNGHLEVAKLLIDFGAEINQGNN